MNKKPKSKLLWRLLRWALIALAMLATLAAVLVTEENWRGKRAWESYRQHAESSGQRLDMASAMPAPVADDQNFFAAPNVAQMLTNGMTFNLYRGDSTVWPKNGGIWQKGTTTDLAEWQRYFRLLSLTNSGNAFPVPAQPGTPAIDILQALSAYNSELEVLRQAGQRPEARLPLNYDGGFDAVNDLMPWLASEKRVAQYLQLRILAELQANQTDAALADIKLFLRLIDFNRNQPFLISHLVRIALQAYLMQPVYEGLQQHRWNDAQLAELEAALAAKDYLVDFQFSMRGEELCAIDALERQRLTRQLILPSGPDGTQLVTNSLAKMPSVYFYRNELAFARLYDQFMLPLVNLTNHTVAVAAYRDEEKKMSGSKHYSLYSFHALMVFPAMSKAVMKFAISQGQVDLARTACALERYRLVHGRYPATLDELTSQFISILPNDLINGQPLHYRRTDDGKFVLYSIGWDEKDDGGQVILSKDGRATWEKGDWVWKY